MLKNQECSWTELWSDETDNKQLDKEDTRRSDLNIVLILLFALVVFNTVLQSRICYFDTEHE